MNPPGVSGRVSAAEGELLLIPTIGGTQSLEAHFRKGHSQREEFHTLLPCSTCLARLQIPNQSQVMTMTESSSSFARRQNDTYKQAKSQGPLEAAFDRFNKRLEATIDRLSKG